MLWRRAGKAGGSRRLRLCAYSPRIAPSSARNRRRRRRRLRRCAQGGAALALVVGTRPLRRQARTRKRHTISRVQASHATMRGGVHTLLHQRLHPGEPAAPAVIVPGGGGERAQPAPWLVDVTASSRRLRRPAATSIASMRLVRDFYRIGSLKRERASARRALSSSPRAPRAVTW